MGAEADEAGDFVGADALSGRVGIAAILGGASMSYTNAHTWKGTNGYDLCRIFRRIDFHRITGGVTLSVTDCDEKSFSLIMAKPR